MDLDNIFIPEHWKNICDRVRPIALTHIFPYIKSKKNRSNILSELFETQSAEYFTSIGIPTESCKSDREPDLVFTRLEKSCEIKVTSSDKREWMGNQVSKKFSEFVLISWDYKDEISTLFGMDPETIRFSVINVYLDKDDWTSLGEEYNGVS